MTDAADGQDRGDESAADETAVDPTTGGSSAANATAADATAADATAADATAADASSPDPDLGRGMADADRSTPLDGAMLAGEVASLVTATVAFVLSLGGPTTITVPGGSVSAFGATVWLLALAAAFAAAKARRKRAGLRSLGHGLVVLGLVVFAAAGSAPVAALGGTVLTAGTLGAIVVVAGLNLVVLDFLQ